MKNVGTLLPLIGILEILRYKYTLYKRTNDKCKTTALGKLIVFVDVRSRSN